MLKLIEFNTVAQDRCDLGDASNVGKDFMNQQTFKTYKYIFFLIGLELGSSYTDQA